MQEMTPSPPVADGERPETAETPSRSPRRRQALRNAWATTRATLGSLLGIAPHVLHHIGFVAAGTALLAGFWGNLALYLVGFLLSIPMLRRLHRRFGSLVAPAVGAGVFTALFLFSAFVLGPAISTSPTKPARPAATATPSTAGPEHEGHHP